MPKQSQLVSVSNIQEDRLSPRDWCKRACFDAANSGDIGVFNSNCKDFQCCVQYCLINYAADSNSLVSRTFPTDQSQVNSLEACCKSTDCCGRLGGMVYGKPCFERCLKGQNCGFECARFRPIPAGGGVVPEPVV